MPTVKQLQKIARERNLKGYSRLRKAELEKLIYGSVCPQGKSRNISSGRCKKVTTAPKRQYAPMRPSGQFGTIPKSQNRQYSEVPDTPNTPQYSGLPHPPLKDIDIVNFQPFSRTEAELFIRSQPPHLKAFVIRPTSEPKAVYAMTYKIPSLNKIKHALVYKTDGGYTFGRPGDGVFRTITDMALGHNIV
jgi:hypothetical protein